MIAKVLAIVIACLGLFGLSGISAMNRTNEIGLRKVLGAGLNDIFVLLNREHVCMGFNCLCSIGSVVFAWQERWLSTFSFRIDVSWQLFAVSMLAGLTVTLLAVSYHTISSAMTDPAKTLRNE